MSTLRIHLKPGLYRGFNSEVEVLHECFVIDETPSCYIEAAHKSLTNSRDILAKYYRNGNYMYSYVSGNACLMLYRGLQSMRLGEGLIKSVL